MLTNMKELIGEMEWLRNGTSLTDVDVAHITMILQGYGLRNDKNIRAAIDIVANQNRYHPIRDFVKIS